MYDYQSQSDTLFCTSFAPLELISWTVSFQLVQNNVSDCDWQSYIVAWFPLAYQFVSEIRQLYATCVQ